MSMQGACATLLALRAEGAMWLITLLAIQFGSCTSNGSLEPNLSLIQPYSYELEAEEPFKVPFLAHFKRGERELVYVAAFHEKRVGAATFKLIDRAFGNHDFRMVVLEGFPASLGVSPPTIVEDFERGRDGKIYHWGEPSYAALKARSLGIPFIGGEPDEQDIVHEALTSGFSTEDLVGFYVVRRIQQAIRDGVVPSASLEEIYDDFVPWVRQETGLVAKDFGFGAFQVWYENANGKAFDLQTFDPEEAAPLARGKYRTQRISHVLGMARDRFVVKLTARMLDRHGRVLVVFGKSHLAQQRPALEEMLGPPLTQETL